MRIIYIILFIFFQSTLQIDAQFGENQSQDSTNNKTLMLQPDDYDKLTYPSLIKLANENSPDGDEMYEKIKSDMSVINPMYQYDVFRGYDPKYIDEQGSQKMISLNKYDAMSGIYEPAKLETPVIEQVLDNLESVNPYLLAKISPMVTLNADQFAPNFNFDLSTGSEYIPRKAFDHMNDQYFSNRITDKKETKNDHFYLDRKAELDGQINNPNIVRKQEFLKVSNDLLLEINAEKKKKAAEASASTSFIQQDQIEQDMNEALEESDISSEDSDLDDLDDQQSGLHLVKNEIKRVFDREKLLAAIKGWIKTPYQIKKKIQQTIKVPVYIPIPIFSYQQVPVVHHYPQKQLVKQIIPVKSSFPVYHTASRVVPHEVAVQQKILIPQAVPLGLKIPVPVPVPRYNPNIMEPRTPPEIVSGLKTNYNGIDNTQSIIDDRGYEIFQKHNSDLNYQRITSPQTKMSDIIIQATNKIPRFRSQQQSQLQN